MENATYDDATYNNNTSLVPDLSIVTCEDATTLNKSSIAADPRIDLVFNGLGLLLLSVVGVTANLLSVIVLSHPRLKSSLTTLLLGLTISDIIVIITSFLTFCLPKLFDQFDTFTWYSDVGEPHLIPWLLPIALTAQMSSVYFTVVITLERYIAVCLPLRARSLCTRSSAKWSAIGVILFSILYNIPRWLEFRVQPSMKDCVTGEITAYEYVDSSFRTEFFVTFYVNWAYLVFMYIVPFTVLMYFNVAIFKQTRLHRTIRTALSPSMTNQRQSGMSEDIQLACMLFGIVITFIACNMLVVVINIIECLGMDDSIGNLIPISNFLIMLACSTNFIFYCVFGTEFRKRLKSTLGLGDSRKRSCSRSSIWTDKGDSPENRRQRSQSLQVANACGSRARSNSHFVGVNNNGTCKGGAVNAPRKGSMPVCSASGKPETVIGMPERKDSQLQSTTTVDTITEEV